ncbi:MAG TPA: DedA family protein [Hyphomicrobiaceae bacterium]|nr:DedA family protein [Hyphomicrobiaceae bacterium]
MLGLSKEMLQQLIATHGYWTVALIVGLESMGIPLPGETVLVLAGIYAAVDPALNIWLVILAAAIGSIIGDNIGYWIGYRYAYAAVLRYGRHLGLSEPRIKVGQYLFRKHGGKVVFFGRFVALLRILAAFLAGVNRMPWRDFLIANAAGAFLWAGVFGLGAYHFGKLLFELHAALATAMFVVALTAFFGAGYLIVRYERRLIETAEQAMPGPLQAPAPIRG